MSDETDLAAAFAELETEEIEEEVPVAIEVKAVEEVEKVDYAKKLEDELDELTMTDNDEEVEVDVVERPADVEDDEDDDGNDPMMELARENAMLLEKVKKYDSYIKRLIHMVDTLGARLKKFGLDHYF
jgi:hypothetical protein